MYSSRIGVVSWSLPAADPSELPDRLRELSLHKLQLHLPPDASQRNAWRDRLSGWRDAGIEVVSAMFSQVGEDYSSPQTIRRTGGVTPDEHWPTNLANAQQVFELVEALELPLISTHAGFIPADDADPLFDVLVQRVGQLADTLAERGNAALLLETGQENAATLLRFLAAADRPNLGVNFDPANLLLYNMGDPIAALRDLLPHIRQVHLKDAVAPTAPGQWGKEVPLGQGQVDWPAFVGVLENGGYQGDLIIEREAGAERLTDIAAAAQHLTSLL